MSIENTMSTKRNLRPRRGWVKFTLAAITLVLVAGSLIAWRASSAKKEEKKPDADKIFEFAKNKTKVIGYEYTLQLKDLRIGDRRLKNESVITVVSLSMTTFSTEYFFWSLATHL